MAYRDENGHFISREEFERKLRQGYRNDGNNKLIAPNNNVPATRDDEEEGEEETAASEVTQAWGGENRQQEVSVETGRGQAVKVRVGSPFAPTIERIADQANYGGFYRVFLNGSEVVTPEQAPERIEAGMRIAVSAYDKVG